MNPESHNRILRNLGEDHADKVKRLARRAKVQIEFARAFAEQQKGLDVKLVEKAEKIVENVGSVEELETAVRKVEDVLAPIGKAAKEYTIHCVGHGHIDMNWIWSWQETVAVTHDTFASVLSLMDEYPDFTYSQSQASVYELTEKYHPEMFKEIQKRVKEGRWEITAAHWVEGDKNLSSGESIARHLLYTRRYIQEKFGLTAEDLPVDWEPDTFGHANTIPSILAQGGVKYYYSCRPGGGHEHARVGEKRPPVFWWEAPDGSRVLVNKETTWYNSYVNIGENVALPMVNFIKEVPVKQWLNVFGIGNHGGGPTRQELDWLNELATYPIYPVLKPSTVKRYFELLEEELPKDLPVFDHELNYEFTGCYTSQSTIKRANRHGENLCSEAETLAVLSGMEVPKENLRRAWINVLFNQFHDILPGSGITQTREHASGLFQETAAITGAVRKEAMKRFAGSVDSFSLLPDTPEGKEARENARNAPFEKGAGIHSAPDGYSPGHGNNSRFRPFVVYNPCAWEREEFVTVDLYDMNLDPSRVVARDEEGVNHPVIDLGNGWDWGHTKRTVAFAAKVPPLGYRTYLICEGEVTADPPKVKHEANDVFKTPFFEAQVDRFNGGLCYVAKDGPDEEYDLSTGVWQYLTESPVGMTSWILGGMPESYQSLDTREFHVHGAPRNEGTHLPLSESIGYVTENQMVVPGTESRVTLRTFIHGLAPRIDFEAEVDWREIGTQERGIPGLQISFDWPSFSLGEGPLVFETPFGSVERTLTSTHISGEGSEIEVPSLRYAYGEFEDPDTHGGFKGITLMQDSKYGHGIGQELTLRIIRSSFDPDHAPEVGNKSKVRYSLYFHDKKAKPSFNAKLGAGLNHPLVVLPGTLQSGAEPAAKSFVTVSNETVLLTSLKAAEEGGLILRLNEVDGDDQTVTVELDESLVQGYSKAEIVDLMERPTGKTGVLNGNRLSVSVPANSFTSIKLS